MTSRFNTFRKIVFAVTFAISVFSISTASYAYTAEEAPLHERNLQVLLIGDPEQRQGHRVPAEEKGAAQPRLQVGEEITS